MIIRRCVVRVGSQAFLHHGEGQRSEREDADPALWPRPRMLATGVSIRRSPVLANSPGMKAKLPRARLKRADLAAPFGSEANSFSAMRAPFESLKVVPSLNVIPTTPSAAVSITSPW